MDSIRIGDILMRMLSICIYALPEAGSEKQQPDIQSGCRVQRERLERKISGKQGKASGRSTGGNTHSRVIYDGRERVVACAFLGLV